MKRGWNYLLAKPFTWMFYAFFQPRRFDREFGQATLLLHLVLIPRLVASIVLVSYPLVLLGRAILLPFHLLLHPDIASTLGEAAGGIAFIVFYFMGLFRVPFYLACGPVTFHSERSSFHHDCCHPIAFSFLHPPKKKQS
jgi:hypothetical protein